MPAHRSTTKQANEIAGRRARLSDDDYRVLAVVQLGDVIGEVDFTQRGVMFTKFVTTSGEDVTKQYARLEAACLVKSRHGNNTLLDLTPAIQKLVEVKTQRALERKRVNQQRAKR